MLSVIIPTLNAGNQFAELIQFLLSCQTSHRIEIIVIDSGSKDSTVEIARECGAKIVQVSPVDFNHGGTRNLGANESQGEYLFFFTQDAIPTNTDYFSVLLHALQEHNAAGGYARQIPRHDASPLTVRDLHSWISGNESRRIMNIGSINSYIQLEPINQYLRCVFDNVASVIRRDVWEQIPFPETPFGEDIEWAYRALINGYSLIYEPNALVTHSHDRSPAYEYKRTFIDHYRLYELFGLRTIPARRGIVSSFVKTTAKDWAYLASRFEISSRWLRWMADVPRNAWASAQGQFDGARAAARGVPSYQSRDV